MYEVFRRHKASGASFDEVVLPHLDGAYRLARRLMRNDEDAEDVVQEAGRLPAEPAVPGSSESFVTPAPGGAVTAAA
jgi:sigma-70-like protein